MKAKQISLANLTPSYVRWMNQASACKRISSAAKRWIAHPLAGLPGHSFHRMNVG